MNSLSEILSLLGEKKSTLLEVEQVSDEMKNAPAEELLALFTKRGELLESAQKINERINALAEGDEPLMAALKNSCEPAALSAELAEIFDESLRAKAVANRILHEEEGIKEHIQSERDELLVKIENLNSGGASVAGSYRRSVKTGVIQNQFNRRSKTI